MRKTLAVMLAGIAVLAIAVLPAASGARKPKVTTFHFKDKVTGAQISATQAVYKTHDSRQGNGAGVQTVKLNGLGGTDTEITYYGNASAKSKGKFKLGTPNTQGISTVTGSGKDTGGTGVLKGFKSKYTYTGTFNTKTLVYKIVIVGTGTLP